MEGVCDCDVSEGVYVPGSKFWGEQVRETGLLKFSPNGKRVDIQKEVTEPTDQKSFGLHKGQEPEGTTPQARPLRSSEPPVSHLRDVHEQYQEGHIINSCTQETSDVQQNQANQSSKSEEADQEPKDSNTRAQKHRSE